MHFNTPLAFLALLLFPLALEASTRRRMLAVLPGMKRFSSGREPSLPFSSPVSLSEIADHSGLFRRSVVLNFLRLLTFACMVTALARPQTSLEFVEVETSGRDIMLTLDISGSMKALDFIVDGAHVERIVALKNVVSEFIENRKGDRMGLIIFGTDVFTQCPLTTDHEVLQKFVENLQIGMVGEGTALGDALALSVKRIRDIPGESKVVILVTDGLKTAGSIDPKEAAAIAKKSGIRVHTIGIGGTNSAPFRFTNPFGGSVIRNVDVPLDVATLQAIADITGGRFFRAQQTDSLRKVYEEVSRIEERTEKKSEFTEYQEQFIPFLYAALFAFVLHQLLRSTKYLIVP